MIQIFNICLIISCVVHVMFIFYNNSKPAIPEIFIENKNIMDVKMPLSFIFCLRNRDALLEDKKYRKAGYLNIKRFFSGISRYNESVIGWLGHMKNGSAFDSLEGNRQFLGYKSKKKLCLEMFAMLRLEEVYLKTVRLINFQLSNRKFFSYDSEAFFGKKSPPIHPNCKLVELNTTSVPKRIIIHFRKTENMSFHMNIVEKNMALTRRRQNSFAYNGPFIELNNLYEKVKVEIGLRVKQSHYSDQDVKTNCINYPTKRFNSFRDCDEDFINVEMQKRGIMPFWAVKGNNNVTILK